MLASFIATEPQIRRCASRPGMLTTVGQPSSCTEAKWLPRAFAMPILCSSTRIVSYIQRLRVLKKRQNFKFVGAPADLEYSPVVGSLNLVHKLSGYHTPLKCRSCAAAKAKRHATCSHRRCCCWQALLSC